jgi:hypothetical protein
MTRRITTPTNVVIIGLLPPSLPAAYYESRPNDSARLTDARFLSFFLSFFPQGQNDDDRD